MDFRFYELFLTWILLSLKYFFQSISLLYKKIMPYDENKIQEDHQNLFPINIEFNLFFLHFILAISHILELFLHAIPFLHAKICFVSENCGKIKRKNKTLITWKKNSIDFMNLFLIWILFSIRLAFQRYTTWLDCKVTKC